MKRIKIYIGLLLLNFVVLGSMQCKKNEIPKTELEKLPPITQTGANTFGCLVNGVAWLPNGRKPNNGGPNIQLYVDPTFQGGRFTVSGNKFNDPGINLIGFGVDTCNSVGTFTFGRNNFLATFAKVIYNYNCMLTSSDAGTFKTGVLNITKYDIPNRIFSGTFEATLFNPNTCMDTIKITNGRFDVKL